MKGKAASAVMALLGIALLIGGAEAQEPAKPPASADGLFGEVAGTGVRPLTVHESPLASFPKAQQEYDTLSAMDKVTLGLTLVAAGDYDGPMEPHLSKPMFEGLRNFQRESGMEATGVPDQPTRSLLNKVGGAALSSWGMAFADHPHVTASLWVPGKMNLIRTSTRDGLRWEAADGSVSIDFTYREGKGSTVAALAGTAPGGGSVDMRMSKADVYAISGRTAQGRRYYARYLRIPSGAVGFRMAWDERERPDCKQLSILMANGLTRSRREGD